MARRSVAAQTTVPIPKLPALPPAPDGLSEPERRLWVKVVESKPVDWFGGDSLPLLTEYIRAACMCDDLAREIAGALRGDPRTLKRLLSMRDTEARRAGILATKLRLTLQSRYGPRKAAAEDGKANGRRPWTT